MNVRAHYNQHRPRKSNDDKNCARAYNNFVKSCLIRSAAPKRYLDLCCGNGGDIGKVALAGASEYFGVELAEEAVDRALVRLKEKALSGDVVAFDAFSRACGEMLQHLRPFDTVGCHFAIHYSFVDELTARTFIQNVAYALRNGGHFIGTTVCSKTLLRRKQALGKKFGDNMYLVRFHGDDVQPFGTPYDFTFKGAVEKLTEYIVDLDVLERLCSDVGMELVRTRHFEVFNNVTDPLFQHMGAKLHDVSGLYTSFEFTMPPPAGQ